MAQTKKPLAKYEIDDMGTYYVIRKMRLNAGVWVTDYRYPPRQVTDSELPLHEIHALFEYNELEKMREAGF